MKRLIALALMSVPAFATAETITFEADSEIMVVRGFDSPLGVVQFDILGSKDGTVLCVAMDEAGKPIATTVGFAEVGYVAFMGLRREEIDRVACRYN
ncbi:MAG TPA: hypothetical protein VKA18_04875 [Alphaproteobacteria bacterium]|nr:hypothetical protein [Alphaproteobacteria bacterium]